MKKLYAFLMALVVLGVISSEVAQAQPYTINSYLVRKIDTPDPQGLGSGSNWFSISGTSIPGLSAYYYLSPAQQMPFNCRFLNQQLTTANTFRVNGYGSVILSPNWNSGTSNYGYDFDAEWFYLSEYGYVYDNYAYDLIYSEGDYGSYGYYPDYKLAPFEGFLTYGPSPDIQYAVLGSAPNRELVVQAKGVYAYAYGSSSGLNGDWQTVVYENAISSFQFNYGPQSGTFSGSWGYYYSYGGWLIESYSGYTAVKANGGYNFLAIGWNNNGNNQSNQPTVAYRTMTEDNATEAKLPQSSYKIFIAYPYDFSADLITVPFNEQPYPINTPLTPAVNITNQGTSVPTSLQVNYTISEVGVGQVYNQTVTIPGAQLPASFQSGSVTMPAFTPTSYGIYEDTVIVFNLQPVPDQNPANNSTTDEFTVSPPNNIKAVTVISPPAGRTDTEQYNSKKRKNPNRPKKR